MRVTFGGFRWRSARMGWRRKQRVRTALVAGVLLLALVVVLSMCDTADPDKATEDHRPVRPVRFGAPPAYDATRGWDVRGVTDTYAVARTIGSVAVLEDAGKNRMALRALDVTSGQTRWKGPAFGAGSGSWTRPRLLEVAKGGREFFVVWSYGDIGTSVLDDRETVVALDIYDAAYGTRRHVEVPWNQPPDVAGGPDILIGRGSDHAAVMDPTDGKVTKVPAKKLGYPKGCAQCHHDPEIRGITAHGLLVRGGKDFWVRGGWHGRRKAPKGTDPGSGLPTSVSEDRVLVRWRKKAGSKHAADKETWAVHDTKSGKVLASADCHRPGIEPGRFPEMTFSFSGRYVVAGPLALDLEKHKGHCYDESDRSTPGVAGGVDVDPNDPAADHGPRPLTLTAVTDAGIAYGKTTSDDAASRPLEVTLATTAARALRPTVHLPGVDVGGYGIFPYTDKEDVRHLVGRPHRTE